MSSYKAKINTLANSYKAKINTLAQLRTIHQILEPENFNFPNPENITPYLLKKQIVSHLEEQLKELSKGNANTNGWAIYQDYKQAVKGYDSAKLVSHSKASELVKRQAEAKLEKERLLLLQAFLEEGYELNEESIIPFELRNPVPPISITERAKAKFKRIEEVVNQQLAKAFSELLETLEPLESMGDEISIELDNIGYNQEVIVYAMESANKSMERTLEALNKELPNQQTT